jgi:tetratricopeptide (TPR) repeat protein
VSLAYRSTIATWERRAVNFQRLYLRQPQALQAYTSLADLLKETGRREEAVEMYNRELRIKSALIAEFPELTGRQLFWVLDGRKVGSALQDLDKFLNSEEAHRLALSVAKRFVQQHPNFGPYAHKNLARAHNDLGALLMDVARFKDAESELSASIDILKRLSVDQTVHESQGSPADNPEHLIELATSQNNLGVLHTRAGRLKEANKAFTEAVSTVRKLRTEFKPEGFINKMQHDNYRQWYADSMALYLMRLGNTLRDTNQFAEAEQAYREALTIRQKELPSNRFQAEQRAYLQTMLAEDLLKAGNNQEAEKAMQEAAKAWEKLTNDEDCKRELALVHYRLSLLHDQTGRKADADAARATLLKLTPDVAVALHGIARVQSNYRTPRWYRDPQRSLELAKQAVELMPEDGETWNALGIARFRTGDWQGVVAPLEKSMVLRKGDSFDYFFLAMAQQQLGKADEARSWYDMAVEWMDKHNPANPDLRRWRGEAEALLGVGKKD